MAVITELQIHHENDVFPAVGTSGVAGGTSGTQLRRVASFLRGLLSGSYGGTKVVQRGHAAQATASIALVSAAAGLTLSINGVRFYAVSGTPVRANREFKVGVSNTADAVDLAATINQSTDPRIANVVTASAGSGTVTLTAGAAGFTGNGVTIEMIGITASGTITLGSATGTITATINGVAAGAVTAGATDTISAALLAAAINASANGLVAGFVEATSAAGVVTIHSLKPGLLGNAISLASSSVGGTATASGTALTGGTLAQYEGAQASGTWTTAAGSGTQHCVVAGVDVSSVWATSDTAAAAAMALAINTTAALQGLVFATSSAGVVTIKATRGGTSGNIITTTASGTGATAQQARLTGGAAATQATFTGSAASAFPGVRFSGGTADADATYQLQ